LVKLVAHAIFAHLINNKPYLKERTMTSNFKLTALAASIAAITACGGGNGTSGGKTVGVETLNPSTQNAVFSASSYKPMAGATDKNGTWVLVSSFDGAEGGSSKGGFHEEASGAYVRAVGIEEGEGAIEFDDYDCEGSFDGGEGWSGYASPELVNGMLYVEEEGYAEDGSCPDNTTCYKLEVEFSSNSEATFTYMEESRYVSGETVVFEHEVTDTGKLVKIANEYPEEIVYETSSLEFSNYDGEKTISKKANCVAYGASGWQYTNIEDDYTELWLHDGLAIYGDDVGLYYERYIALDAYGYVMPYYGGGQLYAEAYESESNGFGLWFYADYFGGPGVENLIEESEFTLDKLTVSGGKFVVSGSADNGEDTLDINVSISLNSAVLDESSSPE
jgi:hypothetical protein